MQLGRHHHILAIGRQYLTGGGGEIPLLRGGIELLGAEQGVLVAGDTGIDVRITQDGWPDKDHQVALGGGVGCGAEQIAQHRDIAKQGHLGDLLLGLFVHQTAQHHSFAAFDQHRVLDGTGIESGAKVGSTGRLGLGDAGDLLLDIEQHRIPFVDLRGHHQLGSHRLALDGVEHLIAGGGALRTALDRDLLTDVEGGLLVVHGDDTRGGENIVLGIGGQRRGQHGPVAVIETGGHAVELFQQTGSGVGLAILVILARRNGAAERQT